MDSEGKVVFCQNDKPNPHTYINEIKSTWLESIMYQADSPDLAPSENNLFVFEVS